MGFNGIIVSCILVIRNLVRLVFAPYKTMRSIAKEDDLIQVWIIFFVTYLYFVYAASIRAQSLHPLVISRFSAISFAAFLLTFFLTIGFFYILGKYIKTSQKPRLKTLALLFAYSLFPTFIWFLTTSSLFVVLPPPRNPTFLGKSFSMIFIVFSTTLLFWRFIMLYLSLRFSMKVRFYTVIGMIAAYFLWFIPYSYLMYKLDLFRIPYI